MSKAQNLQIAISALIEEHVAKFELSDADVMGALRVAQCYEEGAFSIRLVQATLIQATGDKNA